MAHVVCSFHYKSYISLWVHRLVCSKNAHNHLLVWTYREQCTIFVWMCMQSEHYHGPVFKHKLPSSSWFNLYKLMFKTRQCVTVSRHSSLLLFFGLSFEFFLLIFFFRLPVCEWPSALLQLNFWSLVSIQGVFQLETLLLIWPLDLNCSFAIHDSISVWYFARRNSVQKSFNLNIHVKLQKTSETPKSFENNILSCAIESALEIKIMQFFITAVTC